MTRPTAPVRFNPFSAEFRHDPYPFYRQLREARPVHKTLGMWVLTRHADVRDVLRDRRFSAGLIPGRSASKRAG
jgi:cytochrome P450